MLGLASALYHPLNAQSAEAPVWMNYLQAGEISDEKYLESEQVFDPNGIATIRLEMDPSDYQQLISNTSSEIYLQANMSFESPGIPLQYLDQVGIRLRGAAARNSAKKSFKISFEEFGHDLREFYGLQKLNLNCDFQDPHLMRAKICTDLFRRMGVPAARVSYARLYINGDYRGLFANYEQFDKAFLGSRFQDDNGNLYKCDGAPLTLGSGGYTLTTNEEEQDFSDIRELISVLNMPSAGSFKEEIEKVLDVDDILMYVACNVLLGAWDDYWVLVKNYYLYHDPYTDQFSYIPHDFDGSLGTYWYPKDMDVAYDNVYDWSPNPNRPLVEKLLAVPEYRDRYTHYLMLLCMHAFSMEALEPEIDRVAAMIREELIADPYWNWSDGSFDEAMESSLTGTNVDYGLKEYIRLRRTSALEQLEPAGPFQKEVERRPLLPGKEDAVSIEVLAVDRNQVVEMVLHYDGPSGSGSVVMNDQGTDPDKVADDFVYTATIPAQALAGQVRYYVTGTNAMGESSRFPADNAYQHYEVDYVPPAILINEVLASNDTTVQDEQGEYDDFIELYNAEDEGVNLMGMYLTDELSEPLKWRLGDLEIPAGGFLLLWADNDPEQGSNHLGFKLSSGGEEVGLFDKDVYDNLALDSVRFGAIGSDLSLGRTEDGSPTWFFFNPPTPGYGNRDTLPDLSKLMDITDLGGLLAEANDDSPADETIENIIDNEVQTKYLTFREHTWIEYSLEELSRVSAYTLTSANDVPQRDPSNWEFQAYDEESQEWITLHEVKNEAPWPYRFQKKEFTFSNSEWYRSYRLNVSSAHGVDIVQIAELEILGELGAPTHFAGFREVPELKVYPNPSSETLYLESDQGMNQLRVYDLSGRQVLQLELAGTPYQSLDVGSLKAGIYLLHIEYTNGMLSRTRIIKN